MDESESSLEASIREMVTAVRIRIRRGESQETVRIDLIARGVPLAIVEEMLADNSSRLAGSIRSAAAIFLSIAALIALPCAGAIAGAQIGWFELPNAECGLWVIPALFEAGIAGLIGFIAGLGLAFVIMWLCRRCLIAPVAI